MRRVGKRGGDNAEAKRPKVVVVGAGFAGREAIRALAKTEVDVLLIDQHNYHTFWPLLYQVAIAGLEAEQVAHPVRAMVQRYPNVRFRLAEVHDLDAEARRLYTDDGPVDYAYLILATGSRPNFFGLDSVERVAYTLGGVNQAVALRNHILTCFEEALHEPSEARRRALLTFVVVGAGPTGVELAGALAELQRYTLRQDFPDLNFDEVRILVIEMLDTVLPPFGERLQAYTHQKLEEMGVEVMLGTAVESATCDIVRLQGGETIAAHTVIWSAGIRPHLAGALPFEKARGSRVLASDTLQVVGRDEVFVAGDLAFVKGPDGQGHPQLASVAMQQGETAARNVLRLVRGEELEPFEYRDRGTMATIGRSAAVARVFGRQITGFVAWVLWLVVHIFYLMGFRNRLIVLINWAYSYFAYDPGVRLIVGLRRECDPGLAMAGAPDVEPELIDASEPVAVERAVQTAQPVEQEK
jgi:NADH:ubiquinone reductase (H+-translocating)